ncbi:MAG: sortase [Candidatus Doudnabacteria bacterium]
MKLSKIQKNKLRWLGVLAGLVLLVFVVGEWPFISFKIKHWVGFGNNSNSVVQDVQSSDLETQVSLEPNQIWIPSLAVKAPIQYVDQATELVFQEALQEGVVQYPNTAPVGEIGNTYIFGHSSDFTFAKGDYKTVFALLPEIKINDEIYISNEQGAVFEYRVFEQFVALNTDTFLLDQDTNGQAILTLQTSYPIGTALKRYIVKSHLIEK